MSQVRHRHVIFTSTCATSAAPIMKELAHLDSLQPPCYDCNQLHKKAHGTCGSSGAPKLAATGIHLHTMTCSEIDCTSIAELQQCCLILTQCRGVLTEVWRLVGVIWTRTRGHQVIGATPEGSYAITAAKPVQPCSRP